MYNTKCITMKSQDWYNNILKLNKEHNAMPEGLLKLCLTHFEDMIRQEQKDRDVRAYMEYHDTSPAKDIQRLKRFIQTT